MGASDDMKWSRNLDKSQLGGVIFGCTKTTFNECLSKHLFGLPEKHFSYVKNIEPGLPLFMFNYENRNLYGIYEAASSGQLNIDPYAWTKDASNITKYQAQVQICVRHPCQSLKECDFMPIIADNYYSEKHFWFELDHAQAYMLMSKFSSTVVARRPSMHSFPNAYASMGTSITSDYLSGDIEELKTFQQEQTQKTQNLEKKLADAEEEILRLETRCKKLESLSSTTYMTHADGEMLVDSARERVDVDGNYESPRARLQLDENETSRPLLVYCKRQKR